MPENKMFNTSSFDFTQATPVHYVVTAAVTLWCLWAFKKLINLSESRSTDLLLPGPRGLPLVGCLPFLRPNLHQLFMELAQIYGPIYKLSIGVKQCVVISSPTLVKEVVRDHDTTFADRNPTVAAVAFSHGCKNIAFAPYGPDWRLLRKIFVREMLSDSNLDVFYPLRRNEIRKSIRDVYAEIGKPVSIAELAFSTVINMISGMFWGGTVNEEEFRTSIGAEFLAASSEITKLLEKPNVSDFFPVLARFDLQGIDREMKRNLKRIGNIVDRVIDQRKKMCVEKADDDQAGTGQVNKDFLHFLLQFKEAETGRSISDEEIKAMLMDIVIGGTHTTSTMIEWAMSEMMLHPETIEKAREELNNVVGATNFVEESHTKKLAYLRAVVKESLRLHPAAPLLLPRCATQGCHVGGYAIPKGTKVYLNVWAMHRDPKLWDDPSEFRPERFSVDARKLDYYGNDLQYLPFGAGRRICAGLVLGERMLMHVLATLLHMFEWNMPNGKKADTSEKFGVVLRKSTPLVAVPRPRLSNEELYS